MFPISEKLLLPTRYIHIYVCFIIYILQVYTHEQIEGTKTVLAPPVNTHEQTEGAKTVLAPST